jgi:hypothetical protein
MTALPQLRTRVRIRTGNSYDPPRTGVVAGYGTQLVFPPTVDARHAEPIVLVELDAGFYTAERDTFVSVLAIHPDNLIVEGCTCPNRDPRAFGPDPECPIDGDADLLEGAS